MLLNPDVSKEHNISILKDQVCPRIMLSSRTSKLSESGTLGRNVTIPRTSIIIATELLDLPSQAMV
jgi:hypothetical protein